MPHFGKTVSSMCKRSFYRVDSLVVERPLRVREVAGSNPGRVIPKMYKIVPVPPLLGARQ